MRRLLLSLLAAALMASVAYADDTPRPDYSRETLLKILRPLPDHPPVPGRIQWHPGYFEFRSLGMNWRVIYLPLLAPLAGTRLADTARLPNPFELTGTPYASTLPPMFDQDRPWAVQRELNRIERLTKKQRLDARR